MPRVLVVDDEENIRESLSDILSDEGYEVALAESAERALESVRQKAPDLVLLDILIEPKHGMEVLASLTEMNAQRSGWRAAQQL